MSRFADAVRAALEINGVRTRPTEPPSAPTATPTPAPAKRQRRDRVLVLGGPGVLVRDRDGRLPRDGEVEPDGACLRVTGPGGPVLVAGSLRTPPTACRWAIVADLHPIDLEVLRRVAPAHAAEAQQRERVASLTRDVARELGVQFARQGIRVNALCPGPVNTPLLQELFAKDPERAQRRLVHIPVGRFAKPEELAAAVAFLASDDSSFITGSTFLVDGGISSAYVTPLD